MNMTRPQDHSYIAAMLLGWLRRRLSSDGLAWLEASLAKVAVSERHSELAVAIGLAPRKTGKGDLGLSADEVRHGAHVCPGLDTSQWSIDQAARILLLLTSYKGDDDAFVRTIDTLFQTGEITEHIALLRGLPLYPAGDRLVPRACEGVRSAMQPVFEAVAHANPYPRLHFDERQWNQMVLKALFVGSKLAPMLGLDERRNADLSVALVNYAHERWAAGRPISSEIWRCVGPFATSNDLSDLARVLKTSAGEEARAAALALSECPLPEAKAVLATAPALAADIAAGRLDWNSIH